jgi:hypothetical protein
MRKWAGRVERFFISTFAASCETRSETTCATLSRPATS